MLDEITNTDTPIVVGVPAEPAVAEVVPSVAVEQPVIVEVAEQSVVSETQVVSEPELPVSARAESAAEALVSAVVDSVQAPEQPAENAQQSVSAPVGDFGLTPQSTPNEALSSEIAPITPEIQPAEPVAVAVPNVPESPQAPVLHAPEPVKTPAQPYGFVVNLFTKGRAAIKVRKRNKLDRIMGLFAKQTSITNDDAEKLLHISDATASRYLGILEKEGKIKQVGTAGRWVLYTKV